MVILYVLCATFSISVINNYSILPVAGEGSPTSVSERRSFQFGWKAESLDSQRQLSISY
jgi:hypothetical protein